MKNNIVDHYTGFHSDLLNYHYVVSHYASENSSEIEEGEKIEYMFIDKLDLFNINYFYFLLKKTLQRDILMLAKVALKQIENW